MRMKEIIKHLPNVNNARPDDKLACASYLLKPMKHILAINTVLACPALYVNI